MVSQLGGSWRWAATLAIGAALWSWPVPEGIKTEAWHLLAVFAATIASFLLRPMPMGPMVLVAIVFLGATGTIEFKHLLKGFGDKTVWLVVAAFLIAGSVQRTGFGKRVALSLVQWFGRSTLGLGYALCGAELVLGPVVPSNTARGGGILAPIAQSLATSLNSKPGDTQDRAGAYLTLVGAHANLITAAMFMTGMAANPLVARAASDVLNVEFGWGTWALGALVPGLVGLALLPLVMQKLSRPELTDTRVAQEYAGRELGEMGKWSRGQLIMGAVFVLLLTLWSTKQLHGMDTGLVAWIGVLVLLISGVDEWKDVTQNSKAWDCLVWLGGLLAMANALKDEGVVDWFAASMKTQVAGMSGIAVVLVLAVIYFYSMYGFSMLTAHISAMVAAFFGVALAAGAPPLVTVALFAYFSCLCACTTNYSTGPVIIYFGLGYVPVSKWFGIGFLISLYHLVIWLGLGLVWWKLLGWW
ncbi:MAG: DASS family sodium-coupled anion symporter [Planctomycetota bacterium]|nr:DASS family sodium-coupled anion symporter [Planctomycetota bacterium]